MKFLFPARNKRVIVFAIALAACSTVPSHEARTANAAALASAKGWRSSVVDSQPLHLTVWQPQAITPADVLTVYVEGDGLAWLSSTTPSDDPTPVNPVALQLALAQPTGNAVYIARPCQYEGIADMHCDQQYWTGKRFAPEVIDSTNAAVDVLKKRFGAKKLILVGYSGGAAVTALVAERRDDIAAWITVAGNIDHKEWTRYHHMTPLTGSLDPLTRADRLVSIPQKHFAGGRDEVVPERLVRRFAVSMRDARVIVIDDYDHGCCWAEIFKKGQGTFP
jgi:hypothetical protein